MKAALLCGNRYNPWHFQGYTRIPGPPEITVFRAESEIQRYFDERNDADFGFRFERVAFDTEEAGALTRLWRRTLGRGSGREPRIVPFHERLQGYDLIQSWELFTDWSDEALTAREKYGTPLLVVVWDNIPFNMERNPERRAAKERVARSADLFLVHTERSARMLDFEGVPESKMVRVNPCVDTDVFAPGPGKRGEFGLTDDDFVVLFVGWFLPRKGLDFLLMALRELARDPATASKRVRLLMVGSGPGRERVEQLIARLGIGDRCAFAGSIPYGRMPDAFRSADCFVLPSIAMPDWQEQFGMSLIEAMACGTPIITTWSGAIPEIVGDSALLCQPNDFVSLLDAIKALLNDPARCGGLAQSGRTRALDLFTLDRFGRDMSRIYARLTGHGPRQVP